MLYGYEAYTTDGTQVKGTLEAGSQETAEQILWEANLVVVALKRRRRWPEVDELLPTLLGVKRNDIIAFSRQLAILIESGISMVTALRILAEQAAKGSLKKLLNQVLRTVQEGSLLSEACARRPDAFPSLFLRLLRVGEETGNMQLSLRQVADQMQREIEIVGRIRNALAYPAFVLLLAGVAVFTMMNFVLPALMGLFTEFRAQLPLPTRVLLGAVRLFQAYAIYVAVAFGIMAVALWRYYRRPGGRRRIQALIIRLPVIGSIIVKGQLARLAQTMALLMEAGVGLVETMELLIQGTDNLIVRDHLAQVLAAVLQGNFISTAMATSHLFPPIMSEMVRVGEETGTLETNLRTLTGIFEEETRQAVDRLTAMLEPALIIIVGLTVGLIAISVISPMYTIMQEIR